MEFFLGEMFAGLELFHPQNRKKKNLRWDDGRLKNQSLKDRDFKREREGAIEDDLLMPPPWALCLPGSMKQKWDNLGGGSHRVDDEGTLETVSIDFCAVTLSFQGRLLKLPRSEILVLTAVDGGDFEVRLGVE